MSEEFLEFLDWGRPVVLETQDGRLVEAEYGRTSPAGGDHAARSVVYDHPVAGRIEHRLAPGERVRFLDGRGPSDGLDRAAIREG